MFQDDPLPLGFVTVRKSKFEMYCANRSFKDPESMFVPELSAFPIRSNFGSGSILRSYETLLLLSDEFAKKKKSCVSIHNTILVIVVRI